MVNFEIGVHVPLIIRAPGYSAISGGMHTRALAAAVDLYPTLADLAGLPSARTAFKGSAGINGTSLRSVFARPHGEGPRRAAFSQFAKTTGYDSQALHPSCWGPAGTAPGVGPAWSVPDGQSGICTATWPTPYPRNTTDLMGYTVRVTSPRELRYTAWFAVDGESLTVDTRKAEVIARELYDYEGMPAYDADWPGGNTNVIDDDWYARFLPALHALVLGYIRLPMRTDG